MSDRGVPLGKLQRAILEIGLHNLLGRQEWNAKRSLDENPECDVFLHEVKATYYEFPVEYSSKLHRRATGQHFRREGVGSRYKVQSTNALLSANRLVKRGLLIQVQSRPNAAFRLTYAGCLKAIRLRKERMLEDLRAEWERWRNGELEQRPRSFVHLPIVIIPPDEAAEEEEWNDDD